MTSSFPLLSGVMTPPLFNEKVLLRERNRHTARRVASTPSVVLTREGGGYPIPAVGIPHLGYRHPDLARGVPHPCHGGTPPHLDLTGEPPHQSGPGQGIPLPSRPGWGTPPPLQSGPGQGTPYLDLAGLPPIWTWLYPPYLARVSPPIWTWLGYTPPLWTDRWMDGQTRVKTLPSRRTTYVGGNEHVLHCRVTVLMTCNSHVQIR